MKSTIFLFAFSKLLLPNYIYFVFISEYSSSSTTTTTTTFLLEYTCPRDTLVPQLVHCYILTPFYYIYVTFLVATQSLVKVVVKFCDLDSFQRRGGGQVTMPIT